MLSYRPVTYLFETLPAVFVSVSLVVSLVLVVVLAPPVVSLGVSVGVLLAVVLLITLRQQGFLAMVLAELVQQRPPHLRAL